MSDSFQDVYAKHLQHADYGYPLRMPEPMSTLPQNYQDGGLQIGDVGIVDRDGQFDVLFNVYKRDDNLLHDPRGVPKNFQPIQQSVIKSSGNAIPPRPIHSRGIERVLESNKQSSADYEFDSSAPAGAILILPHGAESHQLLSQERFREVATKNALDWYEFAKKCYGVQHLDCSLYLVTGFHKARSWSLGSFNNPTNATGKILARRDDNNPNSYPLEFTFSADHRHSCPDDDSGKINQTVFIAGFKITISSWLPDPVVLRVTESETAWSILVRLFKACLNWLPGFPGGYRQYPLISVEHSPQLSQPFHPSDVINRLLLIKNPNARVAITHDNQWMDMMKEGLTHEDFLQEDRLGTFLEQYLTISVDSAGENTAVFLQGRADGTVDSVSPIVDPHDPSPELEMLDPPASELEGSSPPTSEGEVSPPPTPELEVSPPPTPELEVLSPLTSEFEFPLPPTSLLDNRWTVITRTHPFLLESLEKSNSRLVGIRAQHIPSGLKRIPAGFYVLVHFDDDDKRRTRNKSTRLSDSSIEWEDKILLPSKISGMVRFTIYASFELDPMLGNGEALCTSESRIEELVGGTYYIVITFSRGEWGTAAPDPSLLVTLTHWCCNHPAVAPSGHDSNLDSEESQDLIRETDLGQEGLLRYHSECQREDFENAVQSFECAWHNCPSTHPCRAVVLVNLAKATFVSYQIDPRSTNPDAPILLYREALDLRRPGHPDRPATLLKLAQTLLFRYKKQGCDESVAEEINMLTTESQNFAEDSHERRAADLVLETLERCRVVNSGGLAELDELVRKLRRSAMVAPEGYFDRPQRLINLSTTLWRRHEKHGEPSDLNHSLEINKQALLLLPAGDPLRLPGLRTLSATLWKLFEIRGDFSYLEELIALNEETLQLIGLSYAEVWGLYEVSPQQRKLLKHKRRPMV